MNAFSLSPGCGGRLSPGHLSPQLFDEFDFSVYQPSLMFEGEFNFAPFSIEGRDGPPFARFCRGSRRRGETRSEADRKCTEEGVAADLPTVAVAIRRLGREDMVVWSRRNGGGCAWGRDAERAARRRHHRRGGREKQEGKERSRLRSQHCRGR